MDTTLLNIAAGKMGYLPDLEGPLSDFFVVNLDTMYYRYTPTGVIEERYREWNSTEKNKKESVVFYCKEDVFEFLEKTQMTFDMVTIYRFLEHVSFTQILYFIYLVSTVVRKGGLVDIIVPNYETLADMIRDEDVDSSGFERNNILLTTELLNQPADPHASIWTPQRAKYFWEFENRFKICSDLIWPNFEYDGRDIYLRFHVKRL